MKKARFYTSGLRFSCKRCSSCCRHESGYVFLSEKDLKKLILELNTDKNSFIKSYCRWVVNRQGSESLSLKEKSNNDCILWDSGCTVYQARPLQCRTFPFWKSVLSSSGVWEATAGACPGMNTGRLYSIDEIEKKLLKQSEEPVIKREGGIT